MKLSGSNNDGIDSKELTIVYKPTNTENPPVVRFVNPNTTSSTVTDLNYDVQASVANVSNSNKVQVKVNGTVFSGFRFTNGLVNFNLTLVEGANVIEVRGTNSAGSDSKSVTLFYKKPQTVYPPVVTFEQPSTSPTTVQLANASVQSKVTNVVSKSDIVVKLNGKLSQGFTYSASSKLVSFDVILVEGTNSVEVIGTNSAGSDSKTTLIVYRPRVAKPPVVTIIDPSSNPYEVKVSSYKVVADISNIENANQLTATLNGQNLNVTYNTSSGRLECNVNLVEGENTIAIKAKNVDGEAEDRTIIIYRK